MIGEKEAVAFGMKEDIKRARYAIDQAVAGKIVCIVSSGDSEVYGMSAAVYEALDSQSSKITIEVIPGIPVMCSCASLLGAPISHDCAIFSLSALLTDKDLIKKGFLSWLKAILLLFYIIQKVINEKNFSMMPGRY